MCRKISVLRRFELAYHSHSSRVPVKSKKNHTSTPLRAYRECTGTTSRAQHCNVLKRSEMRCVVQCCTEFDISKANLHHLCWTWCRLCKDSSTNHKFQQSIFVALITLYRLFLLYVWSSWSSLRQNLLTYKPALCSTECKI